MKTLLKTLIATAIVTVASTASAVNVVKNTPVDTNKGAYAGIATGAGKSSISGAHFNGKLLLDADLGYQFNQYFGLELNLQSLPGEKETITLSGEGIKVSANEKGTFRTIMISAKGMKPLTQRFGLYGKLGFGRLFVKATHSVYAQIDGKNVQIASAKTSEQFNAAAAAAGVSYAINQKATMTLGANYMTALNSGKKLHSVGGTVGFTYRF